MDAAGTAETEHFGDPGIGLARLRVQHFDLRRPAFRLDIGEKADRARESIVQSRWRDEPAAPIGAVNEAILLQRHIDLPRGHAADPQAVAEIALRRQLLVRYIPPAIDTAGDL